MPSVQTNYGEMPAGFVGGIVNEEPRTLISRNVEDTSGLAFGLAVMQGTSDKDCTVSDGSDFLGVTVRDQSVSAGTPNMFGGYEEARIMTSGVIWVKASGPVDAGDPVEVKAAGALGTGTANAIANARWDTSAANGELAQLRLAGGGLE